MSTKVAPAPQPVRGGKVGTKIAVAAVLFIAGYLYGLSEGWWGGSPDPEQTPEQERVIVTWEVIWGQIRDTGETYEDTGKPIRRYECEDRELTITAWVDGERFAFNQDESDVEGNCIFRHNQAVPKGAELRMLVEEVGGGGWKMATLWVNGVMAIPNGMARTDGGDDVEVWGLAL